MTTQSVSTLPLMGQALRVFSAYAFVAGLGLLVMTPFQEVMVANATCRDDQTPATLVVNVEPQPALACTIAQAVVD